MYDRRTKKISSQTPQKVRRGSGTTRALSLGLCIVGAALLGNGEAPTAATKLVDAVQRRYEAVQDIAAKFEQEAVVASIGKTERSSGSVTIKRPGRMRWEYRSPEERIIALDGDTIRMYLPEDQQLQVASLDAGVFPPTALDFLLGEGKLDQSFEAKELEANGRSELGLRLEPRTDQSFDYLEIWVSPEEHQLRESVVVDLFGNRTSVRFSEMAENQGVEDAAFKVDVPAGTDVIDLREAN